VNATAGQGQLRTTILVCEDDEQLRMLVEMMLRNHGYRVLLAAHAEQAVEIATAHVGAIDIVVTDVHLPQMTGPDLVERLHTIQPAFDVVFLSGYPAEMMPGQRLPSGCEFLQKPFDETALVGTIRSLLETRHH
jgi:two-component system, cell cycle sensor histidine kinase and response regulator CckA